MGIFGSGWLLAWQVIALVAAGPFVLLPLVAQIRESWHPPMNTPSLGTVMVVGSIGAYYGVLCLVGAAWAGARAGWPWWAAAGAGVAAGVAASWASGALVYQFAAQGGRTLVVAGCAALAAAFVIGLAAPRWVG